MYRVNGGRTFFRATRRRFTPPPPVFFFSPVHFALLPLRRLMVTPPVFQLSSSPPFDILLCILPIRHALRRHRRYYAAIDAIRR